MPSSTRSNKETQLLFSPDPASLERSIRKEVLSSSIDNNTCSSLDFRQPPSTKDIHLPSTDIFHPTSIDTSVQTSIDTEPRDMVATLILVCDERGDLYDQEGHLRNATVVKEEKLQEGDFEVESLMSFGGSHWCRSTPSHEHRSTEETAIDRQPPAPIDRRASLTYRVQMPKIDVALVKEEKLQEADFEVESLVSFGGSHWCRSTPSHEHQSTEVIQNRSTSSPGHRSTTSTESTTSCNVVRIMTHEEFTAKHPHPPSFVYVKINRHSDPVIVQHQETAIYRQPPAPIDRRAPLTYQVQMPKIDVARLNALSPKPKPSENPPEAVRTPSEDEKDSMEVDRVPTGRTLRKRKEKVEKHLKRGANEKEKESFRKRVFRILLDKPFEKAYFTFFRETRETLGECSVKPSKESFTFVDSSQRNSGGIVRDLEVQIGNALVPVDFHVLDIKLNCNSSLLLGRAFLSIVGAVCNLQTNQLCLTLIDHHVHHNPIPAEKPQTTSRRINDPGIIAACHCGAEYETE
ncbi:hypothetical protein F2Q70_00011577 [Brassica cretica]|uniref:Uncharacterized protein n=1 Tax=Brassica cretica TaxID=69181 RepID=A0A8S9M8J6_BRACR|nr:hypothetical protein F2Q70_00011577 [Brassica cretica]